MRFEGKTFENETVTLDYNEFHGCILRNCRILYHGGPYALENTRLERVEFGVAGAARDTLDFLAVVMACDPRQHATLLSKGVVTGVNRVTPPKPPMRIVQ